VLVEKLASPPYTAVMRCLPPPSVDVANDALPPLNVAAPSTVEPSKN
jgi:hypothetical protein